MLLTHAWKKQIIPKVIANIFTQFSDNHYYTKFNELLQDLSTYHQKHVTAISYKGTVFSLPDLKGAPFASVSLMRSSPFYDHFEAITEQRERYKQLTSIGSNWIAVGMAMCHTVDCVCEVFPEFVLNEINNVSAAYSPSGHKIIFSKKATTNPKFLRFIEANQQIEKGLKKQLVVNILTQGNANAANNF